MSEYTLELEIAGRADAVSLTASDDTAARRQALLTVSDVLRDDALNGAFATNLNVRLTEGRGAVIYVVSTTAS